ncbi:MAG: minor capsid protein [Lachnospiraceae bacterium]|nr:minor capsid protein [Lachnospiraceae bacterium]
MKNAEYWRKRSEAVEAQLHQKSEEYYREAEKQFKKAEKQIADDIEKWYARLADNNDIGLAEARKFLDADELEEFKWTVEEYIKRGKENGVSKDWTKELENASAKYHIRRLEAIQLQIRQECEMLYNELQTGIEEHLGNIYTEAYHRTVFEIQKGLGVVTTFATIDDRRIRTVLDTCWAADGKTFSNRIWQNKTSLMNELNTILTQSVIRGENPGNYISTLAKKMKTSRVNASRLIYTESAFVAAQADKDCYKDLGVKEFEFLATLDSHTSEICREMDGQHFPMSEYKIGVNAPPLHPHCRSTTCPYFNDEFTIGEERIARDENGNTYNVPADMTYKEWREEYVQDSISGETKRLYTKYQEILGDKTPSIEEFAKIRYNANEWKQFKAYTSSIKTGELTPLADFELYKNISKQMDELLVGALSNTGVKITGKSNHSIARVIGSIEQRRNGVSVKDVLDALTNKDSEILPVKVLKNGKSQKFRNGIVEVSVNPDTGNIIQVNPVHSRKKVKS